MRNILCFPDADIWTEMDKWFNELLPSGESSLHTKGLKSVIKTPHNLYAIKDEAGNVTENILKVVITPFKREDVKVDIQGDLLTVTCGTENMHNKDDEHLIYRGISQQCWQFGLRLTKMVDRSKITAKIEEGILTIKMPFVKPDPDKSELINVQIG